MTSEQLDQRISIERDTLVDDGIGGKSESSVTAAEIWARVIPRTGAESIQADKLAGKASYTFRIRQREVLESDRIVWKGVRYNIRAVLYAGRTDYIDIDAERGVAQ